VRRAVADRVADLIEDDLNRIVDDLPAHHSRFV
jgi:hypothetical protein